MKSMGILAMAAVGLAAAAGLAQEPAVTFATKPTVKQADRKTLIHFALSAPSDVEVAILDAQGRVVRHLAAGVLGAEQPPPAPLQPGLSQSLEWDGKDDYGVRVSGFRFQDGEALREGAPSSAEALREGGSVRVRVGMGVKLDTIVGGDPYTWYSEEVGQDNHAGWRFSGLEVKRDGSVYLMGNLNFYGPAAVRRYDADGSYRQTVYPPPAGKPVEEMKGWGINLREDGSYVFRHDNLDSSALSTTGISGARASVADLIPSASLDTLLFRGRGHNLIAVNTDGTQARPAGLLVKSPSIVDPSSRPAFQVVGEPFVAPSPDGRHFYLSGLFAEDGRVSYRRANRTLTDHWWRDGQVYKVDAATGQASVFFALDEKSIVAEMSRRGAVLGDSATSAYAALQGVAVDAENHVFICDRQNKRIVIVNGEGKQIREIAVDAPDAIALAPDSRTLFVTRRWGNYHRPGELHLLKFDDWSKDDKPSLSIPIKPRKYVGLYRGRSHLGVARSNGETYVWLAFVALPVNVYQDMGAELKLVKDFHEAGRQRAVDMGHMVVDPRTEEAYVHGGFGNLFRVDDWTDPQLRKVTIVAPGPVGKSQTDYALGFAIDPRGEFFYMRRDRQPVCRYRRQGDAFVPAPLGETDRCAITPRTSNDWRINLGYGERGMAVSPDGSLATLVSFQKNGYSGPLTYFRADTNNAPWNGLPFTTFGDNPKSAGVRFDPQGNMYVGKLDDRPRALPGELDRDGQLKRSFGSLYKYAPTGRLEDGNLFPTAPDKPAKVYDVLYGSISGNFARTSFFGVDGWGRIYYPSSLLCQISVMDNEGNEILRCGTYGNRDSMGGLPGDLVPTKDIPMAYPSSVDATDDFIYVSDIVNVRLLRLAKTFAASATAEIR